MRVMTSKTQLNADCATETLHHTRLSGNQRKLSMTMP